MRTQTVVWTALPNGLGTAAGTLNLSVFMMPRLQTDEGGATPMLSLFPDFANWPATIGAAPGGPLSFSVTFAGHPPATATPAGGSPPPSAKHWSAIFVPAKTAVQPWQYFDYSDVPMQSFPAGTVESFLRDAYGTIGRQNPTTFPTRQSLLDGAFKPARPGNLGNGATPKGFGTETQRPPRTLSPGGTTAAAIGMAVDFHQRPPHDPGYSPPTPTLDFHQALSMLKAYPRLMRMLGLVFDLVVPIPAGMASGPTKVMVTPTWHPALAGPGTVSRDATPLTNCTFDAATFRATPRGGDYTNGMLNLSDTSRFSVIEVDVDGGAERAAMFAAALEQTIAGGSDDTPVAYAPPSLRSIGLSVVWRNWATALNALATVQTAKAFQLDQTLVDPTVAQPVFDAEDLVRGHRFDVYTASEPAAAWRSLVSRAGRYHFPNDPTADFSEQDEGAVVAGGTQAAGTIEPPPPDLYVHETVARWSGWSLAARRPGRQILPAGAVGGDPGNPVPPTDPNAGGAAPPQLSATFTAPPGSLPKLRFGNTYRFRARAADLAGNSVALSSTDNSTMIPPSGQPPIAHLRFDPVAGPVLAPTAVYGPGQGAQMVAILNYSNGAPIGSLGLWLFPPKGSQLLAEEHGMFDGFVAGSAPDPTKGPSGSAATYNLIVGREHASLDDGTLPGFNTDPVRNTPYFTSAKLTTPWLADPLSAGVALLGLPGDTAGTPTNRPWPGGGWPDPEPILLRLSAGAAAGHSYQASAAGSSAIEAVTLPPAGVADVAISSTLTDPSIDLLGIWKWVTDGMAATDMASLRAAARSGQMWLLSPSRVTRLVHAVRLPLAPPTFDNPRLFRESGSHQVVFTDDTFKLDPPSTGTLDIQATWADPLDDPSDPANDPSTAVSPKTAHAFQMTVHDPSRNGPAFAFDQSHGAVHDLGDTKFHLVTYTPTATSRFSEFFRQSVPLTFTVNNPAHVSDLGLDPASVRLTAGSTALNPGSDFVVDAAGGNVTVLKTGVNGPVTVSFIPTDTVPGPARQLKVLASARPAPPKIARVAPAWSLVTRGRITDDRPVDSVRLGNSLRVYLERPWFSSGAGELLGVVTLPPGPTSPTDTQRPLVTLIGRDPITTSDAMFDLEQSPASFRDFTRTANLPSVPLVVGLAEDPFGGYQVFPYQVRYDNVTGRWFADIGLDMGGSRGDQPLPPPAGYIVRLALVRLQPSALSGVEVSPVVVATVAQPVPGRSVTVRLDAADPHRQTVVVQVTGTAYSGWRPPSGVVDHMNGFARQPYSKLDPLRPVGGSPKTSTMVVEVQVQDTSKGLSGELAWTTPAPPTVLPPVFDNLGLGTVTWGSTSSNDAPGRVRLPLPAPGPMRLRISEIDFVDAAHPPPQINTSHRRPFVTLIPLS